MAANGGGVSRLGVIVLACLIVGAVASGRRQPVPAVSAVPAAPAPAPAVQSAEQARREARFQQVAAIARSVKASTRDPDSFKLISIGANDDGSVVCMEYRGKNGFGGVGRERASSVNGKLSTTTADFNRACAHRSLEDMGQVEYAL